MKLVQYHWKGGKCHILTQQGDRLLCGHQFGLQRGRARIFYGRLSDVNCSVCTKSLMKATPKINGVIEKRGVLLDP